MIIVPEVVSRIVDSMRETGAYTSISNVGTLYTLQTPNTLSEDEWVIVFNGEAVEGFPYTFPFILAGDIAQIAETDPAILGMYQAKNVTDNSFDIITAIVPTNTGTWKSLEPFFMYGHRREISNRLLMKDKDKVYKYQKYPLIALRLPIEENILYDSIHEVGLNIAFLAFTDKNYRAPERYANVIQPVLQPLYEDFMQKLQESSEIMNIGGIEHQKTDRLFYGVEALEGNERYIFNDPLDGIELQDLNLKLIENKC